MDKMDADEVGEPSEASPGPSWKIWGRIDAEDEASLPRLPSVSDDGLRPGPSDKRRMPESAPSPSTIGAIHNDASHDDGIRNGSCATGTTPHGASPRFCYITSLPPELVDGIISFLSLRDICAVSETCRALRAHATADHLWQKLVQSKVPGQAVATPHPCRTFRELYAAHDPRWFLTKHKIWFSGRGLAGRLVLVRYNAGRIEGFQMVATGSRASYRSWPADYQVVIHQFDPAVGLHADKPALVLPPRLHHDDDADEARRARRSLLLSSTARSRRRDDHHAADGAGRFGREVLMDLGGGDDDAVFCTFLHARPAAAEPSPAEWSEFPYGLVWPPPAVPARHRVRGVGPNPAALERPTRRADVSDQAFHLRTWVELGNRRHWSRPSPVRPRAGAGGDDDCGVDPTDFRVVGEEVTTYATLDPKLYTPTADKPWRGIWVGDYSGHGCEFLLVNQPDDDEPFDEAAVVRGPFETDAEFERRRYEERVYRGRLEAIKLTGDPNVPRGEFTFVADDLGRDGFVAIVQEPPFAGTRMVKSKGHVARDGFRDDKYIESQLLLISHDRLAQYWVGFGHISFFERVDIDRFLDPANDELHH